MCVFLGPSVLATKYVQTPTQRVWLSSLTNEVIISEPFSGNEIKRLSVGRFPIAITLDDTFAYIVNCESHSLSILDLNTLELDPRTIPVGRLPNSIAIDKNKAYVTNGDSDTVSIINLKTRTPEPYQIPVGLNPHDIKIFEDMAYVVNNYSHTVSCINLKTHRVQATLPVKLGPIALVLDEGMGYVVNNLSHTLSVIDLKKLKVLDTSIPLGKYPSRISQIDHKAYILNVVSHSLSVIDLRTHLTLQSFPVSPFPDDFYLSQTMLTTDTPDEIPLFPTLTVLKSTSLKNLIQEYRTRWPHMFLIDAPEILIQHDNPSAIERLHRLVQDELLELMPPLDALRTLVTYKYPIRYLRSHSGRHIHRKLCLDFLATVWVGKKEDANAMLSYFKQLQDPLFVF